jgi:spore coat polysaccharide biosynthesis protein SpsF
VSNLHPASWPDGNDVEVMSVSALATAWQEATAPWEREHTTPFLWDQPERFRVGNVAWETGFDYSRSHRFTVDYADDLAFVARVFDELYRMAEPVFELPAILALLAARPDIVVLNRRYAGVNWYRQHLTELRTVAAGETRPAPGEALPALLTP